MFMYASAFAISKKLNRLLLLDNETAYLSKKNIRKYGLNNFKITSEVSPNNYKFLGTTGYIKRKILKKIDYFIKNKKFLIEPKNNFKSTQYNINLLQKNFSNTIYLEGYFETQKYFIEVKNEIINEFNFNNIDQYKKSHFFTELNKENSVTIRELSVENQKFLEIDKAIQHMKKKIWKNYNLIDNLVIKN